MEEKNLDSVLDETTEIVEETVETVEETVEVEEVAVAETVEETEEKEEGFLADNVKALSPTQLVIKRFFRSKLSIVGLVLIIGLFLFSFIGPYFSPYGETQIDYETNRKRNSTAVHNSRQYVHTVCVCTKPVLSRRQCVVVNLLLRLVHLINGKAFVFLVSVFV